MHSNRKQTTTTTTTTSINHLFSTPMILPTTSFLVTFLQTAASSDPITFSAFFSFRRICLRLQRLHSDVCPSLPIFIAHNNRVVYGRQMKSHKRDTYTMPINTGNGRLRSMYLPVVVVSFEHKPKRYVYLRVIAFVSFAVCDICF
jgi:hypothetical protein